MSTSSTDRGHLRRQLDDLSLRAERVLTAWARSRDLRLSTRDALIGLLVAPLLLLTLQATRLAIGSSPVAASPLVWALLALLGPVAFVVTRVTWLARHRRFGRRQCLGVFDRQMSSQDRLVIADEFLAREAAPGSPDDPFRAAAIEDAASHITRAGQTSIAPRGLPDWSVSTRSWAAVPLAVLVLVGAMWLGGLTPGAPGQTAAQARADQMGAVAAPAADRLPEPNAIPRRLAREASEAPPPGDAPPASDESSPRAARSDRDAEGQSYTAGQAASRSASQAMSSNGTPSNQQTPSESLDEDTPPEPQNTNRDPGSRPDTPRTPQEATSATSGQGQSRSSSSDTNNIPASDQPDRAGANKDDGLDEEGAQDEVEEEKTTGVERPSLRRNKPPVDRNLSPRPTGDQPSEEANGRSGPGGRKKTRGVPSMILGVPTPDRISGMTNPGRSKVTQENTTPREEPQTPEAAEGRRPRETPFGPVGHPMLSPWMQTLIEKYFLQLREGPPAAEASGGSGARNDGTSGGEELR